MAWMGKRQLILCDATEYEMERNPGQVYCTQIIFDYLRVAVEAAVALRYARSLERALR
jgi:hypothetical protein